jgi:GntR family transcriptional regulator
MIIEIDYKCGIAPAQQIADGLGLRVLTGTLAPGEALPSVKQLSLELRVNPNTVEEAYRALRSLGLVREDAQGRRIVLAPAEGAVATLGAEIVSRALRRVMERAKQLGLSVQTIEDGFRELMREHHERGDQPG